MQIIDVLGDEKQLTRPLGIQACQGQMRRIGLYLSQFRPPSVVELMHQGRVASIGLWRANVFYPMAFPQPIRPSKRREAAFSADSGASQDDDILHELGRLNLSHLEPKSAVNDIDMNVSQSQSSAMVSEAYHHPIGINAEDIDHMGHVNNSVYLKWVQEAVIRYWERVAPPEAVARHLWIALSHEIQYRRPTFLDDLVVADVIAEKVEGARAFFTTVIKRGEVVLAEVKSTWCCLDAVSRRPARLAREIAQRFLPQD